MWEKERKNDTIYFEKYIHHKNLSYHQTEVHNIKNFDHYFEDLQENILATQNYKYKKIMAKMGYQCKSDCSFLKNL